MRAIIVDAFTRAPGAGPELEVTGTPERITGVRVGGVAVTVLEGQLRLD